MLVAARDAGVRVPEPIAYLGDLDGREAFVMELRARRDDRPPDRQGAPSGSRPPDGGGAREDPLDRAGDAARSCPSRDLWQRLYAELDTVDEPHPAIELGIAWCRERLPLERPRVVTHGDFRIGNLMVDEKRDRRRARLGVRPRRRSGRGSRLAPRPRLALRQRRPPPRRHRRGRAVPRPLRRADGRHGPVRTSCSPGRSSATASGRSARSPRRAGICAARSGASSSPSSDGSPPRWSTSCST